MVVTAVMKEVGVAVTEPVPVPSREVFRFTLLSVWAVTDAPAPGEGEWSTGEREVRVVGVVRVGPMVDRASVLISSAWLFMSWLAWSWAAIRSREETLDIVSALSLGGAGGVMVVLVCDVLLESVGSFTGRALSREATLVMPVVCTSREVTLHVCDVLT